MTTDSRLKPFEKKMEDSIVSLEQRSFNYKNWKSTLFNVRFSQSRGLWTIYAN